MKTHNRIAAVFFFIAGLTLVRKKRWLLYYPLFLAACLNRETAGFMIPMFILAQWGRGKPRSLTLGVLAQAVIWLGVKLVLTVLFVDNGGARAFEYHVAGNLEFLSNLLALSPGAVVKLAAFGLIWAAVPFGWKDIPAVEKRLLWLAPLMIGGMFVVGRFQEVRVLAELIPVLTAPAIYGLRRIAESAYPR